MTILQERPHQPIFDNEILAIKEDNEYHLSIVEENNKHIELLSDARDLMLQSLALGIEAIAKVKKIDKRYITLIKEEMLSYLFKEEDDTHQSTVEESPDEESPVEESSPIDRQSTVEESPDRAAASPNKCEEANNSTSCDRAATETEENTSPNNTPSNNNPTLQDRETLHITKPIVGQTAIVNCTRFKGKYNGARGVIIKIKNSKEVVVKLHNGKTINLKNNEIYCNFSDIILEIDILMKKLGWDLEKGRSFLLQHYGKRSRHLLDDWALLDFADKLRQLI